LVQTLISYIEATGRQWRNASHRATPLFLSGRRSKFADDAAPSETTARRLSTAHVRRIVDRVETQWAAAMGDDSASGDDTAHLNSAGRAISPHALRHSTAVALLEGNEMTGRPPASVEHVRGWLGHFDIRTTQGYLAHVDSRRHRRPFALDPMRSTRPAAGTTGEQVEELGPHDSAEQG
jgi:integrase